MFIRHSLSVVSKRERQPRGREHTTFPSTNTVSRETVIPTKSAPTSRRPESRNDSSDVEALPSAPCQHPQSTVRRNRLLQHPLVEYRMGRPHTASQTVMPLKREPCYCPWSVSLKTCQSDRALSDLPRTNRSSARHTGNLWGAPNTTVQATCLQLSPRTNDLNRNRATWHRRARGRTRSRSRRSDAW